MTVLETQRMNIYSEKYLYEFDDNYYFNHKKYYFRYKVRLYDSIHIRVNKNSPEKHFVLKTSSQITTQKTKNKHFVEEIDSNDKGNYSYFPPNIKDTLTPTGLKIFYSAELQKDMLYSTISCIEKVKFIKGTVIHSYLVTKDTASISLRIFYNYLNPYSLDYKVASTYHSLLANEFNNKDINVYLIDLHNKRIQKKYAI